MFFFFGGSVDVSTGASAGFSAATVSFFSSFTGSVFVTGAELNFFVTKSTCSSETEQDDETGEVTVHLSIPEEVVEEVETVKVFVAEYDEEGTLVGIVEREANADELIFTPEEETNSIKTFIWSSDGSPLSVAEIFNLYN